MDKPEKLPKVAGSLANDHPDLWRAYTELGKAASESGPIAGKDLRLVKLALAVGAGLEGAVHSHTRRALREGIGRDELLHVARLAIPTLGLARAAQATTWIEDIAADT